MGTISVGTETLTELDAIYKHGKNLIPKQSKNFESTKFPQKTKYIILYDWHKWASRQTKNWNSIEECWKEYVFAHDGQLVRNLYCLQCDKLQKLCTKHKETGSPQQVLILEP